MFTLDFSIHMLEISTTQSLPQTLIDRQRERERERGTRYLIDDVSLSTLAEVCHCLLNIMSSICSPISVQSDHYNNLKPIGGSGGYLPPA